MTSIEARSSERLGGRMGPWLWGARVDLPVFAGSAALALGLVVLRHLMGWGPELPEWGWVAFVLVVDVAHVYSTLFRTYLDTTELKRHPIRYATTPAIAYAVGVVAYSSGAHAFWRVLAYAALFHFVRQQVGWAALYRARAGVGGSVDKWIDDVAVYASTLYPIVYWHARVSDTEFAWFVQGDFVDLGAAAAATVPIARMMWMVALGAFVARQAQLAIGTGIVQVGKIVVVTTTALIWYVGIVATNSDFDFTVTNVIVHGTPYLALLWAYAKERGRRATASVVGSVVRAGFPAFAALLLLLAFAEELAWDRWVWGERDWLFGSAAKASEAVLAWIVPLLAVPQATHYALDGMLWRRADTRENAAQRAALGFDAHPA